METDVEEEMGKDVVDYGRGDGEEHRGGGRVGGTS
jgi:hypothetical protein